MSNGPSLHSNHPTIYIDDFISYNNLWGYNENDTQREELAHRRVLD